MSIFESIVNSFNAHLDLTSQNIESLTPCIAESVHLFSAALLADKKIICCTSGDNYGTGMQFCHNLLNSTSLQRPGLPAIFLGAYPSSMVAMIHSESANEIYTKPLQALSLENDVLFIISSNGNEKCLLKAVDMAHEKHMPIVTLTSNRHNELAVKHTPSDALITVQSENTSHILGIQYLISLILSELVEQQLFGTQSS